MARTPEIYADAAYLILTSPSRECTGNTFLCEDVLVSHGVTDLAKYSATPGQTKFGVDLYVDDAFPPGYRS